MTRLSAVLASLALAAGLLAGCEWQEQPITWSFERMIRQPSFRAYEAANHFPDSMAMRTPPEGTVSREDRADDVAVRTGRLRPDAVELPAAGSAEAADPAGPARPPGPAGATAVPTPRRLRAPYVDRIPLPLDLSELRRGRDRFRIYCAVCHGIDGRARTPVAANMALRPPPSLLRESLRRAPAGRIFAAITEGYGLMPSYAERLTVQDRWAVVGYVRALQLAQHARLEALPDSVRRAFGEAVPGARGDAP